MRHLVSEAGDPTVVPRPEYVSGLRATIFNRLGPTRLRPAGGSRLLVGSGLAAAASLPQLTLTLALSRPANAWAQVAQALQARPWVHSQDPRARRQSVRRGLVQPEESA